MKAMSNVYLLGFVFTLCMVVINSSSYPTKPRLTRGFKNAALSTARGFGKRAEYARNSQIPIDLLFDFKKNVNGEAPKGPLKSERYSVDWFIQDALSKNPNLASALNKKLFDKSLADELLSEEIFQSVEY
ncbi:hypothetical protein RUM44_004754 [Polyplax serrata]|uniref:Allatotropin n=1 Tax=Polyplax serrata TaxID=468196 RepID=A0ABR1B3S1_POLSC